MKVYHRTANPEAILATGFKGRSDLKHLTGVWFADEPVSQMTGVRGDTVLSIEIPDDVLARYEQDDGGLGYRFFMIPPEIANQFGSPVVHSDERAGCTRGGILRNAEIHESLGNTQEAERLRGSIAFLEAQGLLGSDAAE